MTWIQAIKKSSVANSQSHSNLEQDRDIPLGERWVSQVFMFLCTGSGRTGQGCRAKLDLQLDLYSPFFQTCRSLELQEPQADSLSLPVLSGLTGSKPSKHIYWKESDSTKGQLCSFALPPGIKLLLSQTNAYSWISWFILEIALIEKRSGKLLVKVSRGGERTPRNYG